MAYPISRAILIPLLKAVFIRKTKGLKNLQKLDKNAFIIAANHASGLDPVFISTVLIPIFNKKIHFFALRTFFRTFLLRIIFKKWACCIEVNGGVEKAVEKLEKGEIVGIFPEGRRSYDGNLQKAHKGVALLALKTGMPVLPIGIKGAFAIWPRQHNLPSLKKIIEINIGKPLYFRKSEKNKINRKILSSDTRKIMQKIAKLINQKYKY